LFSENRKHQKVRAFDTLIKYVLRAAHKSGKEPVGEKKLKKIDEELYKILPPRRRQKSKNEFIM
jgi:hypothetical protein